MDSTSSAGQTRRVQCTRLSHVAGVAPGLSRYYPLGRADARARLSPSRRGELLRALGGELDTAPATRREPAPGNRSQNGSGPVQQHGHARVHARVQSAITARTDSRQRTPSVGDGPVPTMTTVSTVAWV